MEDKTNYQRQ